MKDIDTFVERLDEAIRAVYDLSMACNDISYAADLDRARDALDRMKVRADEDKAEQDQEIKG